MIMAKFMIKIILIICVVLPVDARSFLSRILDNPFTIYINGKIYTVEGDNWDQTPQQAMVVNADTGMIEYIGENTIALEYKTGYSEIYDLEGGIVLPGFHDVHMHPLEAQLELGGACLVPKDTPPEEMISILALCNPGDGGKSWVLGHGHSIEFLLNHIEDGGRPPREIIDQVIKDNPVVIMEETSHSVWVNSKALALAGITKDTPNNPGGIIMKDEDTHVPNGILFENAGNEIMDLAMKSFTNTENVNYQALLNGLEQLRMNGITSVCDARAYWKRNYHKAWKRACDNYELTARSVLGLWAYPSMNDTEQIQKLKEMYTEEYNAQKCSLKINEIKFYSDGLLDSTTAAMFEPYIKNLHLPGMSANIGMNYFTQTRFERYFSELQNFGYDKGFDFHIHAIGDRGVEEVLNAIANTKENGEGTRHRMTHLEVIKPRDITRFKELGIIADFQVTGEFSLPLHRQNIAKVIGQSRAENFIPVRSVADTGAIVTLSSDWDVSSLNPFLSIQNSALRGSQSVTVKSAIEMKTRNSAFAMRQENIVGRLSKNMAADFVIIDKDILNIPIDQIGSSVVLLTVLQGENIYQLDQNYPVLISNKK